MLSSRVLCMRMQMLQSTVCLLLRLRILCRFVGMHVLFCHNGRAMLRLSIFLGSIFGPKWILFCYNLLILHSFWYFAPKWRREARRALSPTDGRRKGGGRVFHTKPRRPLQQEAHTHSARLVCLSFYWFYIHSFLSFWLYYPHLCKCLICSSKGGEPE